MIANKNYLYLNNFLHEIKFLRFLSFENIFLFLLILFLLNEFSLLERILYSYNNPKNEEKKKKYVEEEKNKKYTREDGSCIYFGEQLNYKIGNITVHKCLRPNGERCPFRKGAYISTVGKICYNGKKNNTHQ